MAASESIGQRIRRLRREQGLAQQDLAAPGITATYVSRIESGQRRPSKKALRLLAGRLGVTPEYLETGGRGTAAEEREIRLVETELQLRLDAEPSAVEEPLRALLVEAEAAGDAHSAVRARAALGLAAFQRGDHASAIAELELATTRVSPLAQPDLYATLGRAYIAAGWTSNAVALFVRCLEAVDRADPENTAAYVRFATYLSYALTDMGELSRAREIVQACLARADALTDPYTRIRLYWAQARNEAADGQGVSAIQHLTRAIALLETTEDRKHLGRAHLLAAEILTLENQAADAEPHLGLAEELLGQHPIPADLYWLRAEQARLAAKIGRADEAMQRAEEALELIGDSDPAERGTAQWALAEAFFAKGHPQEGSDAFRQAVELLAGERLWHEASRACKSWARLLRGAGREAEAFDVLEQAAELAAYELTNRCQGQSKSDPRHAG